MGKLLVHGGTNLSREVVRKLLEAGVEPTVTVTRSSARDLYPDRINDRIQVGRLTPESLREILEEESIDAVLDATHPFADRISLHAINATEESDIPYLYLDRESVLPEKHELLTVVDDWNDAVRELKDHGRTLLTIGIKRLPYFTANLPSKQLVVRVLPDEGSLSAAKDTGVKRKNIIAMWPPDTVGLERQLLLDYDIETLVTKDSGPSGNLPEKWEACCDTSTEMLVLERPDVDYPSRTTSLEQAVEWGADHARS
ncbi:MAG: precorrin-6A reductase [bacterium]